MIIKAKCAKLILVHLASRHHYGSKQHGSLSTFKLPNCSFFQKVFLGEFPEERFTEVKAQDVLKKFGETLKGISEEIKKRNETLDVPYKYFLPTQVPSSITI